MSWIDKNFADRLNSPAFIHLLTTSVVESCIDGVGKFQALLQCFQRAKQWWFQAAQPVSVSLDQSSLGRGILCWENTSKTTVCWRARLYWRFNILCTGKFKLSKDYQAGQILKLVFYRLEHPNKLLHSIFEILYEDDIIGDEAFLSWETNSDPSKQVRYHYQETLFP